MTQRRWLIATLLIAVGPYSHWAHAEKVYKCGTTYSQTPCAGSITMEVDDTREPIAKKRMDAQTRRDTGLGRDMQRDRLANEAALVTERTQPTPRAPIRKPDRQAVKGPAAEPALVYASKPRLNRPKKPEGFTAVVPGTAYQTGKPQKKRAEVTR